MKKNKPYYLKMYREWVETGLLPKDGLCESLSNCEEIKLFYPDTHEYAYMWGYDGNFHLPPKPIGYFRGFTELRQNVILFLAAMNNEL